MDKQGCVNYGPMQNTFEDFFPETKTWNDSNNNNKNGKKIGISRRKNRTLQDV